MDSNKYWTSHTLILDHSSNRSICNSGKLCGCLFQCFTSCSMWSQMLSITFKSSDFTAPLRCPIIKSCSLYHPHVVLALCTSALSSRNTEVSHSPFKWCTKGNTCSPKIFYTSFLIYDRRILQWVRLIHGRKSIPRTSENHLHLEKHPGHNPDDRLHYRLFHYFIESQTGTSFFLTLCLIHQTDTLLGAWKILSSTFHSLEPILNCGV